MRLFDYKNYKEYIVDRLKNEKKRGMQSAYSKAAGCKNSYFSQMLKTKINLTQEHAINLCNLWQFNEMETEYFLLLLDYARAGTIKLKEFIHKKLNDIRRKSSELAIQFTPAKDSKKFYEYYSSWYYAAIHMALGIKGLDTPYNISKRLYINEKKVNKCLSYLKKVGLADEKNGFWKSTEKNIHLPRESFMASPQHKNIRIFSLNKLDEENENDMFFSSFYSLSYEDFFIIRDELLKTLTKIRQKVLQSKEEDVFCLICDWFKV